MITRLSWCWLGLTLALALGMVGLSTHVRARAYDIVTTLETSPAARDGAGAGRNRIVPPTAYDSLYWIAYAQQAVATGEWRPRTTQFDNAPHGREIHWSSSLTWWLIVCGSVRHVFTGEPMPQAIEYAAAYANPALLMLALGAVAVVCARRFGPALAGLAVVATVSAPQFFASFNVNEPDHHGLINVAALGTLFGLLAGGFGWERGAGPESTSSVLPAPGTARGWFVLSAWCGAAGLWLSAASQILVFIGIGLAAFLAILLTGRGQGLEVARPELWRSWGRWGAGVSLGFYLLEYFPSHFAMHLEVNHPLYAAAWWGAAEGLAAFAAWRQGTAPLWPAGHRDRALRLLAVAAVAAPTAAIGIGGAAWFSLLDPVFRVLPALVIEGESLLNNIRTAGIGAAVRDLAALALLWLTAFASLAASRLNRTERLVVLATLTAQAPLLAAMWFQNRWTMLVAAMAPLLAIVSVVVWRRTWPHWRIGAAVVVLAGAVAAVFPVRVIRAARLVAAMTKPVLSRDDAFVTILNHYAHALRGVTDPTMKPVVLAGPNESVLLSYYGGFRTVGTLYWENLEGLKTAAGVYAAPSLAEAKRLLAERGITHLFSFPPGNFTFGYASIASGALDQPRAENSFAALVFVSGRFPVWLRPIWLPPPPSLAGHPAAQCFEFVPDQTEAEQLFHLQRYRQQAALHAARQP